ncbi:unnamed protein product [Lepeophtheirus salmonis]|uniref:(salmon louse) hypothetical protein n=1 Tax=Lepeophtheirus salmonis TaxID=72036 RepID=A0A7R8D3X4_LEPSM|nr:unnamed protein product [Lepeophtheirus salmonis]CAF2969070.1 unnamed protein product [Lepeophtheirus salmonis]
MKEENLVGCSPRPADKTNNFDVKMWLPIPYDLFPGINLIYAQTRGFYWRKCRIASHIINHKGGQTIQTLFGKRDAYVMYFIRLNNGTFDNEEGKDWEAKLLMDGQSSNFSGMYELVRHDENYEKYLIALGIPYFVVKLILVSPEIIIFDVPLDMKNEQWTIITKAGTDQVDHFKIDEPFIVSMRKALVKNPETNSSHLLLLQKKIEEETIESEKESSPFSDSEEDDLDFFEVGWITTKECLPYPKMCA